MSDIHCFNDGNLMAQLETAPFSLGFYTLRFYTDAGRPVNRVTDTIGEYYLYPSGGTLRDASFKGHCKDYGPVVLLSHMIAYAYHHSVKREHMVIVVASGKP